MEDRLHVYQLANAWEDCFMVSLDAKEMTSEVQSWSEGRERSILT